MVSGISTVFNGSYNREAWLTKEKPVGFCLQVFNVWFQAGIGYSIPPLQSKQARL